jgi:hypothetical protein
MITGPVCEYCSPGSSCQVYTLFISNRYLRTIREFISFDLNNLTSLLEMIIKIKIYHQS